MSGARTLLPRTIDRAVFALATVALALAGALRSKPAEMFVKPLIMLSIQAGLWRTRQLRSPGDNALLALATTASLAGDWLMMEEEFAPTEAAADRWIVRGASAFAINHGALIALSIKLGARPQATDFALRAGGLAEGLALLATRRRQLLAPLGSYSALLASMSSVTAAPQLSEPPDATDWKLPGPLEIGGLSFIASDATILHRRIFLKSARPRAIAEAFVLATYCIAQRLLIDGLDTAARRAHARR